MPYYGYIVVTVEDHRTVLTSADNGEVRPTGTKRIVKIEDEIADTLLDRDTEGGAWRAVVGEIESAIKAVRNEVRKGDLLVEWNEATQSMSAVQMRAALDAIRTAG